MKSGLFFDDSFLKHIKCHAHTQETHEIQLPICGKTINMFLHLVKGIFCPTVKMPNWDCRLSPMQIHPKKKPW
jgi:hypothetical protein